MHQFAPPCHCIVTRGDLFSSADEPDEAIAEAVSSNGGSSSAARRSLHVSSHGRAARILFSAVYFFISLFLSLTERRLAGGGSHQNMRMTWTCIDTKAVSQNLKGRSVVLKKKK